MNPDLAEQWLRQAMDSPRGVIVYLNGVSVLIETALGVLSSGHYLEVAVNDNGDGPAVMLIENKWAEGS